MKPGGFWSKTKEDPGDGGQHQDLPPTSKQIGPADADEKQTSTSLINPIP